MSEVQEITAEDTNTAVTEGEDTSQQGTPPEGQVVSPPEGGTTPEGTEEEDLDTSLTESEEEANKLLEEAYRLTRQAVEDESEVHGKDYGKVLLSAISEFFGGLVEGILDPLRSRGTVHEVNERALYSSDDYRKAVEYAKVFGNLPEIPPNEEYPYGKLVDFADQKVREFFQFPHEETPENRDEILPLQPPSVNFSFSTTAPQVKANKQANGNGEEVSEKYRTLKDTTTGQKTNEWNCLWSAWSDAHKAACEKAASEKPQVFPQGKRSNSRIPTQAYGAAPSGNTLMDWMIEKQMPEVKGMKKGAILPNLRSWGKAQRVPSNKDTSIRVPRFNIVLPSGEEKPYTEES